MIPSNWLALCMVGTAVVGCNYGAAQTVSVSLMGDSITDGVPGDGDGFRPAVATNLTAKGLALSFDYTGPENTGSSPTNRHAGLGGATTVTWTGMVGNWGAGQNRAHVFRILLGVNDLNTLPANTLYTHYRALLTALHGQEPDACFSVARLFLNTSAMFPNIGPLIAQGNVDIAQAVTDAAASGLAVILEADAGIVSGDLNADGTHLVASGNVKQATVAANGIVSAMTLRGFL